MNNSIWNKSKTPRLLVSKWAQNYFYFSPLFSHKETVYEDEETVKRNKATRREVLSRPAKHGISVPATYPLAQAQLKGRIGYQEARL